MHKTCSISLASLPFILEEEAYQALKKYLDGLQKFFKNNPDKDEIIADMENSLAQKFTSLVKKIK